MNEFGIKAQTVGNRIVYEYSEDGETKTAEANKSDPAGIERTLRGIFDAKFGGSMKKQAATFEEMTNNLADQWARFGQMVMASGVFDWMKERLAGCSTR